jgi:hypothetical protein
VTIIHSFPQAARRGRSKISFLIRASSRRGG